MTTTTSHQELPELKKNVAPNTSQSDAANYTEAEKIIREARLALTESKKELLSVPKDTRITQWKKTNFDTHAKLISFLGLPANIAKARDQHTAEGQRLLKHIEKFENELGALEIDLRRKTIPPLKAAAKAAAVVREESADAELVKSWQEHIKTLRDGDQILRHNLAIEVLTPFVKEMSQRKAGLVGSGYEIFRMFKDDGQDKNKESLAGFQLQAIDLEKRLGNIDLAGFTGLALDIIKKQIKVALVTTDRIKSFVEDFRKNPPKEIGAIDQIEENLIAMRVAPANAILAEIEKLSESLAHNLIRLNSKTASMKCFVLLPVLLNEATLLQKTMRNSVVPELKMHITSPGSPLNPQTIAAEMAEVFFMGLKGFWRLIKLFFYSAGGQHPINSVELQKIIIETICSCKSFYGNTKEDVAALKTFIDYQLGEFTRPFPYEDLLQILKTAIATYGSRFEKKLFAFEVIDFEDASPTDKTTLGNLIAVIKKHSATLS